MADTRKTIEVLLTGRNQLSPVLRTAGGAVSGFADATVGHFRRVAGSVVNLQNAIAAGVAGMAARAIFAPAIEMETFETQFAVLLDSTEEAKRHLADLEDFAASTPFQLPGIVRASRTLETLTKGALNTPAGLRMIGDAAAASNKPIEELAMWFGRLYDGIGSNRPVGEALMRLQELGIVSGNVRSKIEDLQKANANSADVWGVVVNAMRRYEGMTERVAQTSAGRLSTLRDNWEAVRREVGEGALPALDDAVEDLLATLQKLRASGQLEAWGEDARDALQQLWEVLTGLAGFVHRNRDALAKLGMTYVGVTTMKAMHGAVVTLRAGLAAYTAEQVAAGAATTVTTGTMAVQTTRLGLLGASVATLQRGLVALTSAGITGFTGWQVGKVIGQVAGLHDGIIDLAAASKKVGATGAYADLGAGFVGMLKGIWQAYDEFTDNVAEKHGVGDYAKQLREQTRQMIDIAAPGLEEMQAARAKTGKETTAPGTPGTATAKAAQKARNKVADELQRAVDAEVKRRGRLHDQRKDALDQLAKQEAREDHDRGIAIIDAQIAVNRDKIAAQRKIQQDAEKAAKDLAKKAKDAWEQFLRPRAQRKADARKADDKKKRQDQLERQLKNARDRQARGLRITKRGKALIEADEIRKKAAAAKAKAAGAKKQIGAQRDDILNLQANRADQAKAFARDLAAAQKEELKIRADIAAALAKAPDNKLDVNLGDMLAAALEDLQTQLQKQQAAARPDLSPQVQEVLATAGFEWDMPEVPELPEPDPIRVPVEADSPVIDVRQPDPVRVPVEADSPVIDVRQPDPIRVPVQADSPVIDVRQPDPVRVPVEAEGGTVRIPQPEPVKVPVQADSPVIDIPRPKPVRVPVQFDIPQLPPMPAVHVPVVMQAPAVRMPQAGIGSMSLPGGASGGMDGSDGVLAQLRAIARHTENTAAKVDKMTGYLV